MIRAHKIRLNPTLEQANYVARAACVSCPDRRAPETGLPLPCNVTVAQMEDGLIQVAIVDPLAIMSVIPREPLQLIAKEARERLNRVISTGSELCVIL
jgi:hypothetical protein